MKEFKCCVCQETFKRYPSQVVNKKRPCCSRDCYAKRQQEDNTEENNPNYRYGGKKSKCDCGELKDYRAKQCAKCARKSYSKGSKGIYIRTQTETVLECAMRADSYADLADQCGVSRQTVTRIIEEAGIDVSHFTRTKNQKVSDPKKWLVKRKSGKRQIMVRRVILQHKLLEYRCQKCKRDPVWMDELLVLDLDHINGNCLDDRLKNLRFLCPNCHSQTPTSKGKNNAKKGKKRVSGED